MKYTNQIILLALIIGASLRITVYLQNRSFIIDEANLARNIVEKSYSDFLKPLDYEQYAPPVLSCALKSAIKLGGVNEYSLTFLSLIAGIGTLILLVFVGRQLGVEGMPLVYLVLLFSFSTLAIRYSTELKQYSLDAFLCLLFVFWFLRKKDDEFTFTYALQLTLLGSLAIWTSMPIVFVLAAIGIQLLIRFLKRREFSFSLLLMIGVSWMVSFGVYYFTILKTDAGSDYLQNFHSEYFFDLLPFSKASLETDFNLMLGLFRSITDKTTISLIGCAFFFGLGVYQLIGRKRTAAVMLLLPLVFCLLASHFKMYSLLTRLTLFLIPMLSLVFIYGFSWVWGRSNNYLKVLLVAFMILTLINKKGYEHYWKPLEVEDSKTNLDFMKQNKRNGESVFVHHSAVPAFVFYNEMYDNAYGIENYYLGKWEDLAGNAVTTNFNVSSGDLFWMFFSHTEPESRLEKDFNSVKIFAEKLKEERAIQSIVQQYKVN